MSQDVRLLAHGIGPSRGGPDLLLAGLQLFSLALALQSVASISGQRGFGVGTRADIDSMRTPVYADGLVEIAVVSTLFPVHDALRFSCSP